MALIVTQLDSLIIISASPESGLILGVSSLLNKNLLSIITIVGSPGQWIPKETHSQLSLQLNSNKQLLSANVEMVHNCLVWRIRDTNSLSIHIQKRKFTPEPQFKAAFGISLFGVITDCFFTFPFLGTDSNDYLHRPVMTFIHPDDLAGLFHVLKSISHRSRLSVRWRMNDKYINNDYPTNYSQLNTNINLLESPGNLETNTISTEDVVIDQNTFSSHIPTTSNEMDKNLSMKTEPAVIQTENLNQSNTETSDEIFDGDFVFQSRRRTSIAASIHTPLFSDEVNPNDYSWVEVDVTRVGEQILCLVTSLDVAKVASYLHIEQKQYPSTLSIIHLAPYIYNFQATYAQPYWDAFIKKPINIISNFWKSNILHIRVSYTLISYQIIDP
ncbi:hypothetical protein HDV02_002399 [Globomyces sp. JEL0801]|nr:hypothetical protein HDV02_002399 [Globomyces sp. JEL0801]